MQEKRMRDDLISRQAAKLKVARVIWEDGDSCYDFHDKCVDCLDDVPSAQPESCNFPQLGATCEDGDELDEAIRHCDEIVQDITWFCNSPSKYIEQRRHESAVKLRQLASWLRELKRLRGLVKDLPILVEELVKRGGGDERTD